MELKALEKYLKDKPQVLIFGTDTNLKNLKLNNLKEIFLASDCQSLVREKVLNYSKLSELKLEELKKSKVELSIICEKSFPVSIIGVIE